MYCRSQDEDIMEKWKSKKWFWVNDLWWTHDQRPLHRACENDQNSYFTYRHQSPYGEDIVPKKSKEKERNQLFKSHVAYPNFATSAGVTKNLPRVTYKFGHVTWHVNRSASFLQRKRKAVQENPLSTPNIPTWKKKRPWGCNRNFTLKNGKKKSVALLIHAFSMWFYEFTFLLGRQILNRHVIL